MKIKDISINKIWRESISTFIICSVMLIGINIKNESSSNMETVEVSSINNIEPIITEQVIEPISIEQLVADVESGKAGNAENRIAYLGDRYNEVQSIINKKYKTIEPSVTTRSSDISRESNNSSNNYQSYAHDLVIDSGWSEDEYISLVKLWNRESGWNPNAHNRSSGAHGIAQCLPASKMASYGDDYYTNGYTQIRWGIDYIKNRYGSPIIAWNHFNNNNWY